MDPTLTQQQQDGVPPSPLSITKLSYKPDPQALEEEGGTITSEVLCDELADQHLTLDSNSSSSRSSPIPSFITFAVVHDPPTTESPTQTTAHGIQSSARHITDTGTYHKSLMTTEPANETISAHNTTESTTSTASAHTPAQSGDLGASISASRHSSTDAAGLASSDSNADIAGLTLPSPSPTTTHPASLAAPLRIAEVSSGVATQAEEDEDDDDDNFGSFSSATGASAVEAAGATGDPVSEMVGARAGTVGDGDLEEEDDDISGFITARQTSASVPPTPTAGDASQGSVLRLQSKEGDEDIYSSLDTARQLSSSIPPTPTAEVGPTGEFDLEPLPGTHREEGDDSIYSSVDTAQHASTSVAALPTETAPHNAALSKGLSSSVNNQDVNINTPVPITTTVLQPGLGHDSAVSAARSSTGDDGIGDTSDAFGDYKSIPSSDQPSITVQPNSVQGGTAHTIAPGNTAIGDGSDSGDGFGDFSAASTSGNPPLTSQSEAVQPGIAHAGTASAAVDDEDDDGFGDFSAASTSDNTTQLVSQPAAVHSGTACTATTSTAIDEEDDGGFGDFSGASTTNVAPTAPAVQSTAPTVPPPHPTVNNRSTDSHIAALTKSTMVSEQQGTVAGAHGVDDDDDEFGEFNAFPEPGTQAASTSVQRHVTQPTGTPASAAATAVHEEEDDDFGDFSTPSSIPASQEVQPTVMSRSGIEPTTTSVSTSQGVTAAQAAGGAAAVSAPSAAVDILELEGAEFLLAVQEQLAGIGAGTLAETDLTLPSSLPSSITHPPHADDGEEGLQGWLGLDVLANAGLPIEQGGQGAAGVPAGSMLPPGMHPGMLQWRGSTSEERLLSTLNLTEIAARAHAREAAAALASTSTHTASTSAHTSSSASLRSGSLTRPALATHTHDPARVKPGELSIRSDNSFSALSNRLVRGGHMTGRVRLGGKSGVRSWGTEGSTASQGTEPTWVGRLLGGMAELGQWSSTNGAVQLDDGLLAWALSDDAGDPPASPRVPAR